MSKTARQETKPNSRPNVLFITNSEIHSKKGIRTGGWLSYLQKEADLQGVNIDVHTLKDVNKQSLNNLDYPLILLDMPYLSLGLNELREEVKKLRNNLPNAQIIVTSAAPDWEYARAAMKAGANDYVSQSIDTESLRNVLRIK